MRAKDGAFALVLLNGELRGARAARAAAKAAAAVICADGGTRHAKTLRVTPHFVVGDMDSLAKPFPRAWRKTAFLCDFDRNRSDLDKALGLARALGLRRVVVAGALGGGLDHGLVNVAALEEHGKVLDITIVDAGTARLLGPGRHRFTLKSGARFSLLAAPRARLSLSGARYALRREFLPRGSRGLGNRALGAVTLDIHQGRVWMVDGAGFSG